MLEQDYYIVRVAAVEVDTKTPKRHPVEVWRYKKWKQKQANIWINMFS